MFSKSFVNGARVGKLIARSTHAVASAARGTKHAVVDATTWLGSQVANDSKRVAHSVAEFGRGVKAGLTVVEG